MVTEQQIEQFIRISRSLNARLVRPGAEEWPDVELTMSQLRTLVFLADGSRRMSEIAASLGTSLSSTTSMIERLESKQLVTRSQHPDDRRVVMCQLTQLGRENLERFWRFRQSRIRSLAKLLTSDEFDMVTGALKVVADALKRNDQSDSAARVPFEKV